jgi:hypothetical protein
MDLSLCWHTYSSTNSIATGHGGRRKPSVSLLTHDNIMNAIEKRQHTYRRKWKVVFFRMSAGRWMLRFVIASISGTQKQNLPWDYTWIEFSRMIILVWLNREGTFVCVPWVLCFASCLSRWRVCVALVEDVDLAWMTHKGGVAAGNGIEVKVSLSRSWWRQKMLELSCLSLLLFWHLCLYTGLPNSAMPLSWSMAPKN